MIVDDDFNSFEKMHARLGMIGVYGTHFHLCPMCRREWSHDECVDLPDGNLCTDSKKLNCRNCESADWSWLRA